MLHGLPVTEHVLASSIELLQIEPGNTYRPAPEIEDYIEEQLRQKPLKFDGVSWRLESYRFENGVLALRIGTGKYSQYRYTNLDPEARLRFPNSRLWFNTLALGALIVTADQKLYFKRRPIKAHLSPEKLDIPCGHPSTFTEHPSEYSLLRALDAVISKETERAVNVDAVPLVLIREEPKHADDFVFLVHTRIASDELRMATKSETFFLDIEPETVSRFLRSDIEVSRPVPLALAYFGLRQFGRGWFESLCQFPN